MKIFLAFVFILVSTLLSAQTQQNSGNWNSAGNWQAGNIGDNISESVSLNNNVATTVISGDNYTIGDLTFGNGSKLYVNAGGILIIGASGNLGFLETNNNAEIFVDGTLEIWGDLNVNNNLVIQVTGDLIIHGDVNLFNNSNFTISGNMIVDGDLNANNNTNFNVNSGSVDVGGDITVGSGNLNLNGGGTFTVGGNCSWTTAICEAILPVDLLSFAVRPVGEVVLVNWATAVEKDNDFFLIQASQDGREFKDLVQIDGSGNSEIRQEYSFTDQYPLPGKSYYRLIQVDFNGERTLYTPVRIDRGFSGNIDIYPNPAGRNESINLFTGGDEEDLVRLTLYTTDGSQVWEDVFRGNQTSINLPEGIQRGTYLLEVRNGVERKLHRLVLK